MLPRSLSFVLSIIVGCVALGGSAACTAESEDEGTSSSGDALSEKSNTIVLAVANTATEDTLDLDVGLTPGAARRIVSTRPFATITALRAIVSNPDMKLLLLYGQSQPIYGDAGADASADGHADASADGHADASADGRADASPDGRADASADGRADASPDAR